MNPRHWLNQLGSSPRMRSDTNLNKFTNLATRVKCEYTDSGKPRISCSSYFRQDVEILQEQQRQAEELKLAEEEKRRLQLERRRTEIEEEKKLIEELKQEQEEVGGLQISRLGSILV